MTSTVLNFLTTTLLTLLTSALLVFVYRLAVRPILVRHNIIPLQQLPETLRRAMAGEGRRVRLSSGEFDEDARVRDLEEAYRDDDDEDEAEAATATAAEGVLSDGGRV
ncbi:hypothetical protein EDC01DRAFT_774750 [Geopyxis carbonaria]|nr:hypothetical protein EDC01DRAFT_774750 [Geopyxis carbonaria]